MPSKFLQGERRRSGYGGRIVLRTQINERSRETCARVIAETGATMIHPFENENVMAGQGNSRDRIAGGRAGSRSDSLSGGEAGVLSGTAVAAKVCWPGIKVIATEPAGADDAAQIIPTSIGSLIRNRKIRLRWTRTDLGAPILP